MRRTFSPWLCSHRLALLLSWGFLSLGVSVSSAAEIDVAGVPTINVTFGQGGSGSFDIFLTATAGTQIQGDQINLGLPSQGFVTFTGESTATSDPYLFSGASVASFAQSGPNEAYVTDFYLAPPFFTSATGGHQGLLHVLYNIAANTPVGSYAMTFNTNDPNSDPFATFFNDANGNFIPFSATGGVINVLSAPANVPEPGAIASLASAAFALVGGFSVKRFRRKRDPAKS